MKLIYDKEQLLEIVTYLSEKYTSKESTSISYEAAEKLMTAVIYCLKEYTVDQQEQAALQNLPANRVDNKNEITVMEAYKKGYQLVIKKTKMAKELYKIILQDFCSYQNRSMEDTIIKGMPCFFKKYDPIFAPQDTILLLDYPVVRMEEIINHMSGIDAIYEYLLRYRSEQKFLRNFPQEYILEKLKSYHTDYEELLENIGCIIKDSED